MIYVSLKYLLRSKFLTSAIVNPLCALLARIKKQEVLIVSVKHLHILQEIVLELEGVELILSIRLLKLLLNLSKHVV